MAWKLVPAGVTLRTQINLRWPDRDHASDGSVGDADHQARPSDHNPDADGWVHAIDVDEDLNPSDPGASERLANQLLEYARTKQPGSGRLKNIVYEDRVASGTYPDKFWVWRYDSNLDHHAHIHISFTDAAEDSGLPFNLPIFKEGDDVALEQTDIDRIVNGVWNKQFNRRWDSKPVTALNALNAIDFYTKQAGAIAIVPTTATQNQGSPTTAKSILDAANTDTVIPPTPGPNPAPVFVLSDADINRIAKAVLDQQAARLVN